MLRRYNSLVFLIGMLLVDAAVSAQDLRSLKHEISSLCTPVMAGRGYVAKGREHAAIHIMHKLRELGLKSVLPDSTYYQYYRFPVVTFPDVVSLSLQKKELVAGEEYLVDAGSSSYQASHKKVKSIDLSAVEDTTDWFAIRNKMNDSRIYLLNGVDGLCKRLQIPVSEFAKILPAGAYIIPQKGKMNWDVATEQNPACVLYVEDSCLPKHLRKASIDVVSKLESEAKSANVMGMVRGTSKPDSFIVITAHYDHLGKMGQDVIFPGASDNASGTAMMLQLAAYYAKHPLGYSILFIAFSGEEAGLLGSTFYVKHPIVALSKMRFLINLDIMGNAQDGITVVNATEFPREFSLLENLNKKANYLPQIRSRGKAAISDHYPFTEAGVPAFFMYSNGGQGYYHDVFDTPAALQLTNIDKVMKLLIEFAGNLN